MPDDDPLEHADRRLGILAKLAVLPILLDMLLQLGWGVLGGCCWGCCLIVLLLLLYGSLCPWLTRIVVLLAVAFIIWAYWKEAIERRRR